MSRGTTFGTAHPANTDGPGDLVAAATGDADPAPITQGDSAITNDGHPATDHRLPGVGHQAAPNATNGHHPSGNGHHPAPDGRVRSNGHIPTSGHAATSGHIPTSGHAATSGHIPTNGHAATSGHAAANGHAATSGHEPGRPAAAGGTGWRGAAREWALAAAMVAVAHPLILVTGVVLFVGPALLTIRELLAPLLAWTAAALIAGTTHQRRPVGHTLRPDDQPELATLVRQVAEALEFRAPLSLRVVPEPEVALLPTRVAGSRVFALVLGWPLLNRLTAAQLAAVLARVLAREQHAGSRRTATLLRARQLLVDSLDNHLRAPAGLARRLLRATQPVCWRVGAAADADAAAVAGTGNARASLERQALISQVFAMITERCLVLGARGGGYPDDLYEAFDAALMDPYVGRRALMAAVRDDMFDPLAAAADPPLRVRLAAVAQRPGTGRWDSIRSVRLHEADALREWCVRSLFDVEEVPRARGPLTRRAGATRTPAGGGPTGGGPTGGGTPAGGKPAGHTRVPRQSVPRPRPPVRMLDSAPECFGELLDDARAALIRATGADSAPDAVSAAVDAIADGSWPVVARAIDPGTDAMPQPMRDAAGHDALVGCLARAVSGALIGAGWARASRWLASVLVAPGGQVVDLRELIEHAVDTGDVTTVRPLLAHAQPGVVA